MCDPVTIAIGAAVLGAGASAYTGMQQADATKKASAQATQNAKAAADQQDQALNKAYAKQPNTQAINSQNQVAAAGGPSSTMLTGPGGVDPGSLSLGKNTLLGM